MTSQRVEVSVYELRITNPEGSPIEPNELHDYIMDAFVNDKIKLGKARRMLALCEQPAEIVQHEV